MKSMDRSSSRATLGEALQREVAGLVAEGIVDVLELVDVCQAHAQGAGAAIATDLLVNERVQDPPAVVGPGQAIVPAFAQAPAQVMDVSTHEREPRQHRGQHQAAQQLDRPGIEPSRLVGKQPDDERISAENERAQQQKGARIQAEHAEEHDHRVDEQEHRARRAQVKQGIGDNADGREHHRDRQAGIVCALIQTGAEDEVQRDDRHQDDAGRNGEGLRREDSRQDADAQQEDHGRGGPGGDQKAAKTDSLFPIIAWKQRETRH